MEEAQAYERSLWTNSGLSNLMNGAPGPQTLAPCRDIMTTATSHLLKEEADIQSIFDYGSTNGHSEFRQHLAAFLSQHYGDPVNSEQLMVTAGALPALHLLSTLLIPPSSPVFVEDPTFFGAFCLLRQDLQKHVVSVPCDDQGMDTEVLDKLLTTHRLDLQAQRGTTQQPLFWTLVFAVSVYNNPTGRCYSAARCRELVRLARKHDVLVVTEDVYNLIHFGEAKPPPRLLTYDNPSDPDFRGHVLSSGTFSKILAPGLRLGWIEAPARILTLLCQSNLARVAGSLNHYTSRLVAVSLKLGLQTDHLKHVTQVYKKRMAAVCQVLRTKLPKGATFFQPEGGLFLWVVFPEGTDTTKMLEWVVKKTRITFVPGICTSPGGTHGHCARLSISVYEEDVLKELFTAFCQAAKEFLLLPTDNAGAC